MATPVEQLIVEIRAETKHLRKGLEGVKTQLQTTNKVARSSVLTFGNLARVFAAIGFTRLITGVVNTTRTFEDLRATLQANTGSIQETNDAFDLILDFTATTTFQIEQVTQAFIEFRRLGISPTREQLKGIGNVAAAQGQSIDQVALAIFRGGTTSIEQLQSLGFTAKTTGNTMDIAFGDISATIDKSVESVLEFVAGVGDIAFPDAIEQRARTLTGAVSNLGDRVSVFQNQIGEAGLKTALIDLTLTFNDLIRQGGEGGLADVLGQVLGGAIQTFKNALLLANRNADALKKTLVALFALLAVKTTAMAITAIGGAFTAMAGAARAAKTAIVGVRNALVATTAFAMTNPISAAIVLGTAAVAGGTAFAFKDELKTKMQQIVREVSEAFEVDIPEEDLQPNTGDSTGSKVGDITNKTGKLTEGMEQLQEAVVASSMAFTKNFVDSLMEGRNALDAFKDFSRNVVSQIITIFMQMEVVNRILANVFPQLGIEYGGIVTPAGGGTTVKKDNSAGGGRVGMNVPTLVGERGPELFVPQSHGTVLNNMNTKNALGGGQPVIVNQSINFATGVVPTVRAEVTKMLPQIADVTKGAVLESAMRGGAYRRGLTGG